MRLFLASILAAFTFVAWSAPDGFVASVVYVNDGDTIVIEVDNNNRDNVRIVSIDAPEKGRRGVPGQPYSERSRQHLYSLVGRRDVRLISLGRDDYGRLLARVWIGDVDVGLAQVCAGYAWVFDKYIYQLPVAEQRTYQDCETKARQERRGLWRGTRPMAPWQWRYSRRDAN
ncbi:MAG: thermonuclease family protein [Betaproteobacteria bacterium]|nr:MAG: thermonuclease family protein [Betaproteobacteria bacterium]